jgi:hypothetical protein
MFLAIVIGSKHNLRGYDQIVERLIWPVFVQHFDKDPGEAFKRFLEGYLSGSAGTLQSQITRDETSISVNQDFADAILLYAKKPLKDVETWAKVQTHLLKNLESPTIVEPEKTPLRAPISTESTTKNSKPA